MLKILKSCLSGQYCGLYIMCSKLDMFLRLNLKLYLFMDYARDCP